MRLFSVDISFTLTQEADSIEQFNELIAEFLNDLASVSEIENLVAGPTRVPGETAEQVVHPTTPVLEIEDADREAGIISGRYLTHDEIIGVRAKGQPVDEPFNGVVLSE